MEKQQQSKNKSQIAGRSFSLPNISQQFYISYSKELESDNYNKTISIDFFKGNESAKQLNISISLNEIQDQNILYIQKFSNDKQFIQYQMQNAQGKSQNIKSSIIKIQKNHNSMFFQSNQSLLQQNNRKDQIINYDNQTSFIFDNDFLEISGRNIINQLNSDIIDNKQQKQNIQENQNDELQQVERVINLEQQNEEIFYQPEPKKILEQNGQRYMKKGIRLLINCLLPLIFFLLFKLFVFDKINEENIKDKKVFYYQEYERKIQWEQNMVQNISKSLATCSNDLNVCKQNEEKIEWILNEHIVNTQKQLDQIENINFLNVAKDEESLLQFHYI